MSQVKEFKDLLNSVTTAQNKNLDLENLDPRVHQVERRVKNHFEEKLIKLLIANFKSKSMFYSHFFRLRNL